MDNDTRSTRRAFVTRAAQKAAYVAPAVLALHAARRAAADFTGCIVPVRRAPCTTSAARPAEWSACSPTAWAAWVNPTAPAVENLP